MPEQTETPKSPVTRLITKPDASQALEVQHALLRVTRGADTGRELEIGAKGCVVGTADSCQLVLSDSAVSHRHLELVPTERGFHLRDLESRNGTLVNGVLVESVYLTGNHQIEIGESELHFSLLDAREELPLSKQTAFGPLLGRSVAMRQAFALLERVAGAESTVLLEGESGTGKDLAAETMHLLSPRREQPFIVVDCGAMQSNLVESELFGHTKGAFTGAASDRAGAFEAAQGGTVFLDEIGELDPRLQPTLLRLLEKREIKRLGENRYRPVDVRLLAATNRDLSAEVAAGRFREDLFYRLSVVRVRMPPLRERRVDVGMLARSFVQQLSPHLDPLEVISDDVEAMLKKHDWPGNVRELRNVVERLLLFPEHPAAALGPGKRTPQEQPNQDMLDKPFHEARRAWTERFERRYLSAVLTACDGVVLHAAKMAAIPRQTFHRLMAKHGLNRQ